MQINNNEPEKERKKFQGDVDEDHHLEQKKGIVEPVVQDKKALMIGIVVFVVVALTFLGLEIYFDLFGLID